jgi:regulator of nonsense transcripts 2
MSTADYVARYPRRRALLENVEKFWLEDARSESKTIGTSHKADLPPEPAPPLDSSLKKHTTLLNRLRSSLLVGPSDVLIKEIDGLTLTKYLDEIVGAVVEGASKGRGDPDVAVDVSPDCSCC